MLLLFNTNYTKVRRGRISITDIVPRSLIKQRWKFIKENKKERKKGREHALDQENDQENDQEKKKVSSFFLGRFLGRERVFFSLFSWSFFLVESVFSCFLTLLFSFINSHHRTKESEVKKEVVYKSYHDTYIFAYNWGM